jgi:hypothetical protein
MKHKNIKGRINKVALVKEIARDRLGMPRPTRLVPDKRRKLLTTARKRDEQ